MMEKVDLGICQALAGVLPAPHHRPWASSESSLSSVPELIPVIYEAPPPRARHCSAHFICAGLFNITAAKEGRSYYTSTLRIRELRHREVKYLPQVTQPRSSGTKT